MDNKTRDYSNVSKILLLFTHANAEYYTSIIYIYTYTDRYVAVPASRYLSIQINTYIIMHSCFGAPNYCVQGEKNHFMFLGYYKVNLA